MAERANGFPGLEEVEQTIPEGRNAHIGVAWNLAEICAMDSQELSPYTQLEVFKGAFRQIRESIDRGEFAPPLSDHQVDLAERFDTALGEVNGVDADDSYEGDTHGGDDRAELKMNLYSAQSFLFGVVDHGFNGTSEAIATRVNGVSARINSEPWFARLK